MIKKIIFNTAKEAFRRGFRKYKRGQKKEERVPYDLVKSSIKRSIRSTKFMDKTAYQQAPKTTSIPRGGNPRIVGKAYASDKAAKKTMMIPMMTKQERAANQEAISDSVRKFLKDKMNRKKYGGVMKAFKGKYFDEQKTNVKGKDRTGPVPGGKTPEIPPEEFMKHKKYKHRRVISAKVGINVNAGGESALGRLQKSGMLKAYTGKAVRQPSETNKEFEMRHAYHTPFMKYKPKMLLGGLLTKGIRQGIKSYVKASGKKTKDLVKLQPMKSRTSAKTDMARGIQLHTKSLEDKKRLQKYIRSK